MLEIEAIENAKSDKESNKYVMVATLQQEECSDQESESDEVISVKAFRQKREDKRDKEAPWNTSRDASRRAKELLEKSKEQAQKEKPDEGQSSEKLSSSGCMGLRSEKTIETRS